MGNSRIDIHTRIRSKMAPQDLSGTWLCVDIQGDPDGFLSDMGMGYVQRTMASTMGYGKGRAKQVIQHDGDRIVVTSDRQGKTKVDNLVVGGGPQEMEGQNGEKHMVQVERDGDTIVVRSSDKGLTIKRFIEGDRLVQVMTSQKGKEMRRVHQRE